MLGIWLSVAQVVISGYQPLAEQTWVQLNPAYYPLERTPPEMFVAWHGNQYPPLAKKKMLGRWQVLFPARLTPPFDLFEGEAQLSKTYLARLRRIDELAYGVASNKTDPVASRPATAPRYSAVQTASSGTPFIAEFQRPQGAFGSASLAWKHNPHEPLLAQMGHAGFIGNTANREVAVINTGEGEHTICHRVVAGETLWHISNELSLAHGEDIYSYLLALVAVNPKHLNNGIKVKTGEGLYCPNAQTLARFNTLSPGQRHKQFEQLEQRNMP
ncbi:MAG: hypothetical protein ACRC6D_06250 [Aeromonas sp.]